MGRKKHRGSRFWQCRRCGCEKNVQGKCRVCGYLFQDNQKARQRSNGYKQPKSKESGGAKNAICLTQETGAKKGPRVNIKKMVKMYRQAAIAARAALLKNQGAAISA